MIRPLALAIGLRYTRAKRRNHFVSFISVASLLGVALGVAALITVLSVMNGFEKELRARILGMVAHVSLTGSGLDGRLHGWQPLLERAGAHPRVVGAAPYIEGQGMLTTPGAAAGVVVRGVDSSVERSVSDVADKMVAGALSALRPGEYGVALGRELAARLGVRVGDGVSLLIPDLMVTPAGPLPRMRRFTVVGLFEIGMFEYDSGLALLALEDAARLFRLGDAVSGVRLKLDDPFAAPTVGRAIAADGGGAYRAVDWSQRNANFFRAIRMEKRVMFVILTLIVAVAAFNLIATLVMAVVDKEGDIAVLRTLGATPRLVMAIFMVQGAVIGVAGTLLGILGGVALALNVETLVPAIERLFDMQFLAADVYYITDLPSDLRLADVAAIGLISLLLCLLATLYPARRAAAVQPAEALRHE